MQSHSRKISPVRLNMTILANLYLSGYRFILYSSGDDFAIVKPLIAEPAEVPEHAYCIPILEREVVEMAEGEAPFPVYVKL